MTNRRSHDFSLKIICCENPEGYLIDLATRAGKQKSMLNDPDTIGEAIKMINDIHHRLLSLTEVMVAGYIDVVRRKDYP